MDSFDHNRTTAVGTCHPTGGDRPASLNVEGELASRARIFEYTAAADPSTFMSQIPFAIFPAEMHAPSTPSGIVPLDLSQQLRLQPPATTPNLAAAFVHARTGDTVTTDSCATSSMYYAIRGSGSTTFCVGGSARTELSWRAGDLFTVPGHTACAHTATEDAALYWVNDSPLLTYLGAAPAAARFAPTLYTKERLAEELSRVNAERGAASRNRNGVLLGTEATAESTKTLTHTLWALWNALPAGVTQPPHRHQSVALDLCVSAGPDTCTLMSHAVDGNGNLVEPVTRAAWTPGSVFVTPPGMWHSHVNRSSVDAIVLPVQDAGLYTHQRTLDIQFAPRRKEGGGDGGVGAA
jgi:gentisate 1,2-dioxygenase